MKVVYEMCQCPAYSLVTLVRIHVCLSQLYYLFIWYLSFLENSDDLLEANLNLVDDYLTKYAFSGWHLNQREANILGKACLERQTCMPWEGAVSCQEGTTEPCECCVVTTLVPARDWISQCDLHLCPHLWEQWSLGLGEQWRLEVTGQWQESGQEKARAESKSRYRNAGEPCKKWKWYERFEKERRKGWLPRILAWMKGYVYAITTSEEEKQLEQKRWKMGFFCGGLHVCVPLKCPLNPTVLPGWSWLSSIRSCEKYGSVVEATQPMVVCYSISDWPKHSEKHQTLRPEPSFSDVQKLRLAWWELEWMSRIHAPSSWCMQYTVVSLEHCFQTLWWDFFPPIKS